MKNLKKNGGITLVALVITVIILLILAAISIQALTNQGIFARAEEAKKLTEEKTAEENAILTNYLEQMNTILGGQVTEKIPDGAVVTPINDITTWLKTGGISKQYSYTTIEQVIADNTCTESLMNNENAMKYLARSTGLADAICTSETTMAHLGQSAYVDDTVLNSDLWISKISSSSYWDLIYPSVTVHSSASATITVSGKSFTSDTSGNTQHSMPWGTFSISDSVSGQSFECTIGRDTTDVYVMPEGVVYWYGNECEWITGGFEYILEGQYHSTSSYNTNGYRSKNAIANIKTVKFLCTYSLIGGIPNSLEITASNDKKEGTNKLITVNLSTDTDTYLPYVFLSSNNFDCYSPTYSGNKKMNSLYLTRDYNDTPFCPGGSHGIIEIFAIYLD